VNAEEQFEAFVLPASSRVYKAVRKRLESQPQRYWPIVPMNAMSSKQQATDAAHDGLTRYKIVVLSVYAVFREAVRRRPVYSPLSHNIASYANSPRARKRKHRMKIA